MTVPTAPGTTSLSAAPSSRSRPRSAVVAGALSVLLALWLGLTAPSVSPVDAGGPQPAAATLVVGPGDAPAGDVPVVVDPQRGRRGRR